MRFILVLFLSYLSISDSDINSNSNPNSYDKITKLHTSDVDIDKIVQSREALIKLFYSRNHKINYNNKEDVVKISSLIKLAGEDENILGILQPNIDCIKNYITNLYNVYKKYNEKIIYPLSRHIGFATRTEADFVGCNKINVAEHFSEGKHLDNDGKLVNSNTVIGIDVNTYVSYLIKELIKSNYPNVLKIDGFGPECEQILRKYTGIIDDNFYKVLENGLFS